MNRTYYITVNSNTTYTKLVSMSDQNISGIVQACLNRSEDLDSWGERILSILQNDDVVQSRNPVFLKKKIKDEESIRDKIKRVHNSATRNITPENVLNEISDLVGARLVMATKKDITPVVERLEKLNENNKFSISNEKHYAWHPEEFLSLKEKGKNVMSKNVGYCSRHFILVPAGLPINDDDYLKCELQLRTALEEAMFENDHRVRHRIDKGNPESMEVTTSIMKRISQLLQVADRMLSDAYDWSDN